MNPDVADDETTRAELCKGVRLAWASRAAFSLEFEKDGRWSELARYVRVNGPEWRAETITTDPVIVATALATSATTLFDLSAAHAEAKAALTKRAVCRRCDDPKKQAEAQRYGCVILLAVFGFAYLLGVVAGYWNWGSQ